MPPVPLLFPAIRLHAQNEAESILDLHGREDFQTAALEDAKKLSRSPLLQTPAQLL
jgi:hypothetical protein